MFVFVGVHIRAVSVYQSAPRGSNDNELELHVHGVSP